MTFFNRSTKFLRQLGIPVLMLAAATGIPTPTTLLSQQYDVQFPRVPVQDTAYSIVAFDSLWENWYGAPSGSEKEASSARRVREYVQNVVGTDAIEAYEKYLISGEKGEFEKAKEASDDLSWPVASEMLEAYFLTNSQRFVLGASASDSAHGETGPLHRLSPSAELEVTLQSATVRPSSGETIVLYGEIKNVSDTTIWIVDRFTTLNIPPAVFGAKNETMSIRARFPSLCAGLSSRELWRIGDAILRLEPKHSYRVLWEFDVRLTGADESDSALQMQSAIPKHNGQLQMIQATLDNYLFFRPGIYQFTINMHVWTTPPVKRLGQVMNVGESFTHTESLDVEVEPAILVLIIGSIVGGLIGFLLSFMSQWREGKIRFSRTKMILYLNGGIAVSVLLCGIGTVLISRLGEVDFMINLKVNDFWGAIASGFVIQMFGVERFVRRIARSDKGRAQNANAGQEGGADASHKPQIDHELVDEKSIEEKRN